MENIKKFEEMTVEELKNMLKKMIWSLLQKPELKWSSK